MQVAKVASVALAALWWQGAKQRRQKPAEAGKNLGLEMDAPDIPLRKIKRMEAVLQRRIKDVIVVLGRSSPTRDCEAVVRTCECLGTQRVWLLEHPPPEDAAKCKTEEERTMLECTFQLPVSGIGIDKRSKRFLTWKKFSETSSFVNACKMEGTKVWCVHCLGREEYNFDFAKEYKCEDSVWGDITKVQDIRAGDIPKKLALVFCFDKNGFARDVVEMCDKYIAYDSSSSQYLPVSLTAAMIIHRITHLKRQKDRVPSFQKWLSWALGRRCNFNPHFDYASSLQGHPNDLFKGDLDRNSKIELRRSWFRMFTKDGSEVVKLKTYEKYLKNPIKPFEDLRPPDEYRVPRIHDKIMNRQNEKQRQREEKTKADKKERRQK